MRPWMMTAEMTPLALQPSHVINYKKYFPEKQPILWVKEIQKCLIKPLSKIQLSNCGHRIQTTEPFAQIH